MISERVSCLFHNNNTTGYSLNGLLLISIMYLCSSTVSIRNSESWKTAVTVMKSKNLMIWCIIVSQISTMRCKQKPVLKRSKRELAFNLGHIKQNNKWFPYMINNIFVKSIQIHHQKEGWIRNSITKKVIHHDLRASKIQITERIFKMTPNLA